MMGSSYHASNYFNPRSREGSDIPADMIKGLGVTISIHAPARGATGMMALMDRGSGISIHAPARGAT